jgi:hypothetical protein
MSVIGFGPHVVRVVIVRWGVNAVLLKNLRYKKVFTSGKNVIRKLKPIDKGVNLYTHSIA